MSVIWDRPRRMKGLLKCWCRCFTRISTSSLRDRLGARRAFNGLRRDATATEDESVIGRTVAAQREELGREIGELKEEAGRVAEQAWELVGEVLF